MKLEFMLQHVLDARRMLPVSKAFAQEISWFGRFTQFHGYRLCLKHMLKHEHQLEEQAEEERGMKLESMLPPGNGWHNSNFPIVCSNAQSMAFALTQAQGAHEHEAKEHDLPLV